MKISIERLKELCMKYDHYGKICYYESKFEGMEVFNHIIEEMKIDEEYMIREKDYPDAT